MKIQNIWSSLSNRQKGLIIGLYMFRRYDNGFNWCLEKHGYGLLEKELDQLPQEFIEDINHCLSEKRPRTTATGTDAVIDHCISTLICWYVSEE